MGITQKTGNTLQKLKSAAQKKAAGLPAGHLINAVVDQVNQFENGIRHTVDGVQDKVRGLQASLLKMVQANKELELEKTNALIDTLGHDVEAYEPMTLADIYHLKDKNYHSPQKKIGFKH